MQFPGQPFQTFQVILIIMRIRMTLEFFATDFVLQFDFIETQSFGAFDRGRDIHIPGFKHRDLLC